MSNDDYISQLQATIQGVHCCAAAHKESVFVHERVGLDAFWQGYVEIFDLTGHPQAKRCFGWSMGHSKEIVTVLDFPVGINPHSAVKVALARRCSLPPPVKIPRGVPGISLRNNRISVC